MGVGGDTPRRPTPWVHLPPGPAQLLLGHSALEVFLSGSFWRFMTNYDVAHNYWGIKKLLLFVWGGIIFWFCLPSFFFFWDCLDGKQFNLEGIGMIQRLAFNLPHGAFGMFGKCARGGMERQCGLGEATFEGALVLVTLGDR